MSDNTTADPGSGGDVIRDKDRAGVKTQIVGIDLGIGTGTESLMSGAMPVTDNSGSLTVDNGGTFAVQDSQKLVDNAGFTDGTTPVQPAGYVFDEVAGTALTENDAAAARIDSKRAQVLVIEDATTRGQRAAVSSGGAVKVDGSAATQPVSGTVTANAGTGPWPVTDNSGSLTVDAAASTFGVNNAQVSGTAIDVNSGTKSAGTQRVVIATDQPQLTNALKVDGSAVTQPVSLAAAVPVTDNSGSLTVDAPVGTPVFVTPTPSSTGGWTPKVFTALTAKTLINGAACAFGGHLTIYNPNAVVAYIQVFDAATTGAITLGTTPPTALIIIPPTSAANVEITNGIHMVNGIVVAATTNATGSTAVGAGLDGTLLYK